MRVGMIGLGRMGDAPSLLSSARVKTPIPMSK